jgi:predicted lipoprotein with Yx(FWY)xxD motif
MRAPALLVSALLLIALLAAGCGENGDDDSAGGSESGSASARGGYGGAGGEQGEDQQEPKPQEERKGTTIKLADSQFGSALFDGDDQAIYSFGKETTKRSECYGQCAVEWPPVLTKGEPQARGEVAEGKLGTTERRDGKTQVTYNGHPLYYYFDEGPGELRCHNVSGFGGLWLALDKAGNPL